METTPSIVTSSFTTTPLMTTTTSFSEENHEENHEDQEAKELDTQNSNQSLFGMSLSSPAQALNDDNSSSDSSWSDEDESGGGLFGKPLTCEQPAATLTTSVRQETHEEEEEDENREVKELETKTSNRSLFGKYLTHGSFKLWVRYSFAFFF